MDSSYGFPLRLERLAMVEIAASLWRLPYVLAKIEKFFIEDHLEDFHLLLVQYVADLRQKESWGRITNYITTLPHASLPAPLRPTIMYLVEQMGMRIFEYLRRITSKLLKYSKTSDYAHNISHFIHNLQWTSLGTIDSLKIFRTRYDDPSIEKDYFMWVEACNHCLEDCAKVLWEQRSSESKEKTISKVNSKIDDDFFLVAYWQSLIDEGPDIKQKLFINNRRTVSRLCNSRDSTALVMFKLSVHLGNPQGVHYFWSMMTNEERTTNAISGCEIILERRCTYPYCYATYCKSCSDIFCFLLLKMTTTERNQLIANEFDKTYDPFNTWILLLNWPWEELFVQTLEGAWGCFSIFDCKFFINKFETTVYTVEDNYRLAETSRNHKEILGKICMSSPRNLRPHFTSRYKQLTSGQAREGIRKHCISLGLRCGRKRQRVGMFE